MHLQELIAGDAVGLLDESAPPPEGQTPRPINTCRHSRLVHVPLPDSPPKVPAQQGSLDMLQDQIDGRACRICLDIGLQWVTLGPFFIAGVDDDLEEGEEIEEADPDFSTPEVDVQELTPTPVSPGPLFAATTPPALDVTPVLPPVPAPGEDQAADKADNVQDAVNAATSQALDCADGTLGSGNVDGGLTPAPVEAVTEVPSEPRGQDRRQKREAIVWKPPNPKPK